MRNNSHQLCAPAQPHARALGNNLSAFGMSPRQRRRVFEKAQKKAIADACTGVRTIKDLPEDVRAKLRERIAVLRKSYGM